MAILTSDIADKLIRDQGLDLVIPDTYVMISEGAFEGDKLTSVVIPESVTTIGEESFKDNQLTSIFIPDSVTSIGNGAFEGNLLTSVDIPDSVTTIGEEVFEENQLTSVVIPDSVTSIGDGAFCENQLTSVVIPDSVTTIGDYAFEDNLLTSVFIPDSVTSIGDYAFDGNYLDVVGVPKNVNPIVAYAFDGDVAINGIKIRMVFSPSHSDAWISNELDENTPQGIVAELVTDDPDLDLVHSYSLVQGDGDDDNYLFEVDKNQLRIFEVPDYERKANYVLRIKTSYSDGRSYSNKVNIKVNNLNESDAPKSVQSLHKEWLFSVESSEDNDPADIAIDSHGGIFVVGGTESPAFLGEQVPQYNDDLSSGYIFKVSPEGNIEWTELIHGNGVKDYSIEDVAVDNFNNAYVLGFQDYDKAFISRIPSAGLPPSKNPIPIPIVGGGGGGDIQIDSSGSIYAVTTDNYLSKYEQWDGDPSIYHLKVDKSGGETTTRGIEIGSDGSMYIVGHHLNKTTGDKDGHLMKYSSDGTKVWERVFGGNKDEKAYEVIQSSDGSIYAIGATQSTIFDGQVNTQDWVDSETWDKWDAWECFLIKYNTEGDKEWTRLFGGSKRDKAYDLSEGADGSIYIVGETSSPDFVGKDSVRHVTGSFFTSFTPGGEEKWTNNAFQNNHSEAIAIAKDGSIVVGGGHDVALIKYIPDTVPDADGDGFVDEVTNYQMWTAFGGVDLQTRLGQTFSDDTSRKWDAVKAVEVDSGFSVLLEGHRSKEGKYKVVEARETGIINGSSRWLTERQMFRSGYEEVFDMDFNDNGMIDFI